MLMVLLVPGLLAFVFGWLAFRSRVTGVYLSIITQAMTYALWLSFFRNDMGFGGNNGLTDFKDILGFPVQAQSTRAALFFITAVALMLTFVLARVIVSSAYGRCSWRSGTRRAARASSLPGGASQAAGLGRVRDDRGRGGRALRAAAGRHHQPVRVPPRQLDRGGGLGGDRRTRHAGGRGARRGRGQLPQDRLHQRSAGGLLAVCAGERCS